MDLALRNAMLIDGSGRPGVSGDLGVEGGKIVAVGKVEGRATEEIDVKGAVVAPGFIDVHTHYDAQAFWDPMLTPSIFHGVTSVVAGNCGFTLAPLSGDPQDWDYLLRMLSRVEGMPLSTLREVLKPDWSSFGGYLDKLDGKLALNTAFMVGHSALRRAVMGARAVGETATADDLENMKALLRRSLAEGGMGFSTTVSMTHTDYEGEPVPSRWADREEILALCKVTGEFAGTWLELVSGKLVFTEEDYALTADMSASAQRALNWNLLMVSEAQKASVENQLQASDYARARGGQVYALVPSMPPKPILTFATGFFLDVIPNWPDVLSLPHKERRAALADPGVRARLLKSLVEAAPDSLAGRFLQDVDLYVIEIATLPHNQPLVGKTIGEYAAAVGKAPFDALLDLVVEEDLQLMFSLPTYADDDASWRLRGQAWADDRCIVGGSDAGAHLDVLNTFAFSTQLLETGVRERGLLSLEEAVRLMTSLPAERFGLVGRGRLEKGACADIVVFDPATVACGPIAMRADLPGDGKRLYAEAVGVRHVIVNGTPVVRYGAITGKLGGRVLRSGRDTTTVPLSAPSRGEEGARRSIGQPA